MTINLIRMALAGTLILSLAAFSPSTNPIPAKPTAPTSAPATTAAGSTTLAAGHPAPTKPEPPKRKFVVIGYVSGYNGRVITDPIDAGRLTHINYSFVDIRDGRAWLHHEATDTTNLRMLVGLKSQNPDLKILISIGGWSWSKLFSDAVLTEESRAIFAASALELLTKYKLDGIDIDWEFPDQIGDGNKFRPEDKQNYTLFFKKLREGLDSVGKISKQHYFISTAVGADQRFLNHTEMGHAAQYLDFVNIMSYDFKENNNPVSGHHTNLYASKETQDPEQGSVDRAVHEFEAAGVPSGKLVVGVAFYAHVWSMQTTDNHGLYRASSPPPRTGVFHDAMDGAGGYTYIKDSLVDDKTKGYTRYWDKDAHAPYLFQPDQKIFLSYDDEESATDKCKYVEKNQLGGVMFWDYNSDRKGYLLQAINIAFGYR